MIEELREAYEKLDKANEGLDMFRKALFMSPSAICSKFHIQNCHMCEREDCSDNTNPVLRRMKKLEEVAEAARRIACEVQNDCGCECALMQALADLDSKEAPDENRN